MKNENKSALRKIALMSMVIIATALIVLLLTNQSNKNSEAGGEYVAQDSLAFMVYKNEAFFPNHSYAPDNSLRADLAYFARKTINDYKSGKVKSVVFNLKDKESINDTTTSFEGVYEKSKDAISISYNSLNNGKIHTSIINKKTKISFDNELPSNTKRNQFIGTLPIQNADYSIAYLKDTEGYFITITSISINTTLNTALAQLRNGLGVSKLNKENISIIAWSAEGTPKSLPNPDI